MTSAVCIACGMLLGCAGLAVLVTRPELGSLHRFGLGVMQTFSPEPPKYTKVDLDRISPDSSVLLEQDDFDSWYRS
ncbi:MAG: hypothetical protein AB2L09_02980 [Coriobacteriia bacterium]